MIVDQFSAALYGGAGIAARRLHESLRASGVESRLWYRLDDDRAPASDDSYQHWTGPPQSDGWLARRGTQLQRRFRKILQQYRSRRALAGRPKGLEHFSSPWRPQPTPWDAKSHGAQVVHLHWVADFLEYSSFFAGLPRGLPVVWTLHDLNPFTGGCHYTNACEGFTQQCGHCPQLGRPGEHDLSARGFQAKLSAYADLNLHVIAPSRWMAAEARRSRLLGKARSIQVIRNAIDTRAYAPIEKSLAKARLGLPPDKPVIAFGAESLTNHRKGFALLLEALARLPADQEVWGLAFGGGKLPESRERLPRIRHLGFVTTPAEQSLAYSAADVFALPSLEENLAQTGVEALACGTPVVAFRTGGLPDYVFPGETGLLAEVGDAEDLARQITWLLQRPEDRQRMGQAGRALIEREYAAIVVARHHRHLYESLLEGCLPSQSASAA